MECGMQFTWYIQRNQLKVQLLTTSYGRITQLSELTNSVCNHPTFLDREKKHLVAPIKSVTSTPDRKYNVVYSIEKVLFQFARPTCQKHDLDKLLAVTYLRFDQRLSQTRKV